MLKPAFSIPTHLISTNSTAAEAVTTNECAIAVPSPKLSLEPPEAHPNEHVAVNFQKVYIINSD